MGKMSKSLKVLQLMMIISSLSLPLIDQILELIRTTKSSKDLHAVTTSHLDVIIPELKNWGSVSKEANRIVSKATEKLWDNLPDVPEVDDMRRDKRLKTGR